jgi:hypothetical protein
LAKGYWQKNARKNVGEINPWGQFYERFSRSFFVQTKQNVTRKKTFVQKICAKKFEQKRW